MKFEGSLFVFSLLLYTTSSANEYWGFTNDVFKFASEWLQQSSGEPRDEPYILQEYDFIIVGAGSAGCVLANRLTEVAEWKVLLIEAGGEEDFLMDVPLTVFLLQFTGINWNYKSVPSNRACLGLVNDQCVFPRGKVMGGSSVLNYMIYTRGNRRDYDNWEAMGNAGWGYDDVFPYFLKSEDLAIPELTKNNKYHRTGGYLTVSYPPYRTPLAEAFIEAGRETGQRVVDYNGETQTGFSYVQTTTKNGTRWSTSRAFLHPIRKRKNLHVKKRSQVTKILIDPVSNTAYGVEFVNDGKSYVVYSKKEVILSAGAVNSPQLLMLSGVGPRDHLEEMKIPVVQDLSVGYNLMDHMSVIGITFTVNDTVGIQFDHVLKDSKDIMRYFRYHDGPFSTVGTAEAIAFYDFKHPHARDGYPDIELLFMGGSVASYPVLKKSFGLTNEVYDTVYKPIEDLHSWMVIPQLLRPKSRGRVTLSNNNPFHKPLIYHNYLDHPDDMETILKGVKKVVELGETKAFKKFNSKLHDIPIPGCDMIPFGSDDYWRCVVRHLTFSIYHLSGTCKMGPSSDIHAVVDPRLRVHGVSRLRVIDASIMPVVISAHTNAPTIMIAEKGADIIKEDWGIKT